MHSNVRRPSRERPPRPPAERSPQAARRRDGDRAGAQQSVIPVAGGGHRAAPLPAPDSPAPALAMLACRACLRGDREERDAP